MLPEEHLHQPSFSPAAAPPQVLLEDLTLVIDVALLVAFATAVHLLRQKLITVATLAHSLSVAFLVFTAGHYVERHVVGMDRVEDLVSRRGPGQGGRGRWWPASWPTAGLLSIGAAVALGTHMLGSEMIHAVLVCSYVAAVDCMLPEFKFRRIYCCVHVHTWVCVTTGG